MVFFVNIWLSSVLIIGCGEQMATTQRGRDNDPSYYHKFSTSRSGWEMTLALNATSIRPRDELDVVLYLTNSDGKREAPTECDVVIEVKKPNTPVPVRVVSRKNVRLKRAGANCTATLLNALRDESMPAGDELPIGTYSISTKVIFRDVSIELSDVGLDVSYSDPD
jgi:hypothetical protein